MIRHEDIGVKYLLENGYKKKDIRINNGLHCLVGIPDITTNDNKEWEVKIFGKSNRMDIEYSQSIYFTNNVNILIFRLLTTGNYTFLECIKWKDFKSKYRYTIRNGKISVSNSGFRLTRYEQRAFLNVDREDLQIGLERDIYSYIDKSSVTI